MPIPTPGLPQGGGLGDSSFRVSCLLSLSHGSGFAPPRHPAAALTAGRSSAAPSSPAAVYVRGSSPETEPPAPRVAGPYRSSVHRPLLLGLSGFHSLAVPSEFFVAMGTLNMSGRPVHSRPLQVPSLLPTATRRCLMLGMLCPVGLLRSLEPP